MLKQLVILLSLTAPVLAFADEIFQGYQVIERPVQRCWTERVAIQQPNYGGLIIGGLAGGLLGNQVGGGHGREAATALGAVTGAYVGNGFAGTTVTYQNVQRCRTVYERVEVPVYRREEERFYDHDHERRAHRDRREERD